jgi:CRP-like cAMP-binding protein
MANAFIAKLERFARLSSDDKQAIAQIALSKTRTLRARSDIIREGEQPEFVNLILSGWAFRYKELEDGRRQIVALFLPGDLCDLNVFILREMDHSVGCLTDVEFSELSREAVDRLTLNHPRITQALWWETLVAHAIQREWTTNVGQRQAFERMAHLFCEVYVRLQSVGLARDNSCEFPMTQQELGEATGLSSVHVNRTLQELRTANLIVLKDKTLIIPDLDALQRAAMFNPNYLHLAHEGRHLDANE